MKKIALGLAFATLFAGVSNARGTYTSPGSSITPGTTFGGGIIGSGKGDTNATAKKETTAWGSTSVKNLTGGRVTVYLRKYRSENDNKPLKQKTIGKGRTGLIEWKKDDIKRATGYYGKLKMKVMFYTKNGRKKYVEHRGSLLSRYHHKFNIVPDGDDMVKFERK